MISNAVRNFDILATNTSNYVVWMSYIILIVQ